MSDTKKPDSSQLNAAVEKLLRYVNNYLTELNEYPKPLQEAEAKALIEKYGYDNALLYLEKLANYRVGLKKYTSVYLTVNSWLREDVKANKITIPQVKSEVKREAMKRVVWSSDEIHKARELFLADFPQGAVIPINSGTFKRVNRGGLETPVGEIIDASEFIVKNMPSYLYLARETMQQENNKQNAEILQRMQQAREQEHKTNQDLLAEALAKFQMKTKT